MSIIFFFFGLIIGSFLNAVIYRLYAEKSIAFDRSLCPSCQHSLGFWDLFPVLSFVFLGGRCRYCRERISWQYPLVELLTATSFLLIGYKYSFSWTSVNLWSALIFASFFIVIAVFDLKHYLILDRVVLPASVSAVLFLVYESVAAKSFGWHSPVVGGLLGAVVISGFFAAQYYFSSGKWIGFGDVKLGIFLGLVFGFGLGLMYLFVSYCIGAAAGLVLIFTGKKDFSSRLPFGTVLGFSGIIMLIYGEQILAWYLRLTGL